MSLGTSSPASLRLTRTSSQSLSRTFGAGGSRTTWTVSFWVKLVTTGLYQIPFSAWSANDDTNYLAVLFASDNKLYVAGWNTSFVNSGANTYTDTTKYYHVVVAVDTNNGTANNRVKLYVDGVDVTNVINTVSSGASLGINQSGVVHRIGVGETGTVGYVDGNISNFRFVNNQQLTPTSFLGGTGHGTCMDAGWTGGVLGTNGFFLSFINGASQTTLGYDDGTGLPNLHSGSNDWTLNATPTQSLTDYPPVTLPFAYAFPQSDIPRSSPFRILDSSIPFVATPRFAPVGWLGVADMPRKLSQFLRIRDDLAFVPTQAPFSFGWFTSQNLSKMNVIKAPPGEYSFVATGEAVVSTPSILWFTPQELRKVMTLIPNKEDFTLAWTAIIPPPVPPLHYRDGVTSTGIGGAFKEY